ncbi:MAG: hypothetical protein KAS61_07705 [Spirochaetes bacterium]|nr:hypothetical protein [Spirochaetota bacterium]
MSTLTDLFNVRIGAAKRAAFLYIREGTLWLLRSSEKLPLKERLEVYRGEGQSIEEMLSEIGIEKESLYYLLSPGLYFRNRITLPFTERQKIEGIIRYEVKEYLPDPEGDYLTDFYTVDTEVYSFSTEKEHIHTLLEELGSYRDNLRAVIPYDTALLYAMKSLVDDESYVLVDIRASSVYIQCVEGLRIRTGIRVMGDGVGDADGSRDELFRELRSQLIMVFKTANPSIVYLNVARSGEKTGERFSDLLKGMEISYQEVPHYRYERSLQGSGDIGAADVLPLYGMIQEVNQTAGRVNLLKDEFRPRMKGYVSVREFSIVGGLLLILLILATSGLAIDIRTRKGQISLLRERVRALSSEVYGDPSVTLEESKVQVSEMEGRLDSLKTQTDARFSCLQLLKELSLYLPDDVVMEYSDLIIGRDRIKFSGKARTFSDIDRIRQELLLSEYFTDVRVSNTGTTGSTEGFTVTFVFDIDVVEDLSGGD